VFPGSVHPSPALTLKRPAAFLRTPPSGFPRLATGLRSPLGFAAGQGFAFESAALGRAPRRGEHMGARRWPPELVVALAALLALTKRAQ
jgi:hypothetical protein